MELLEHWSSLLGYRHILGLGVAISSLSVASRSEAHPDDGRRANSVSVGIDFGYALPRSGDFLSGGYGKSFVLEFSRRNWRVDWRLGESYSLKVKDFPDVDVGASMDVQSFSFSYIFPGAFRPKLGLGAAIFSSSVAFLDSEDVVQVQGRGGLGVVASGELVYVKTPRLHFVLSGRAYFVEWERVSAPVIVNADNSMIEESIEPDNGIPISLSLGLRISL